PAVQRVRDSANRVRCISNLHQIGLALQSYHDTHHRFPPGASYHDGADPAPFMSWNTRLLPFIEQDNLWRQTVQAFIEDKDFADNPPHIGFTTVMNLYACPADPRTLSVGLTRGELRVALTAYLGVSGSSHFLHDGILYLDSGIRMA